MFDKNKNKIALYIDSTPYYVDREVLDYVDDLRIKLIAVKQDKERIIQELVSIKPIVEDKRLKPLISQNCSRCKYAVRSTWNEQILKCCKDCVCEDFSPKEEKE